MDRRTAESPMDFEWQTRAPGDATSPFYQLGLQQGPKRQNYSVFDSPGKPQNQRSFSFAPPTPQRPASPSRPNAIFGKPAFQTPRKFDAADYSSGPENMSSPENNNGADDDDEEEDATPEPVQKKEKRNSLFGLYGRFAPSPGRGGIPKVTRHTTDQARRVHKRRLRDRDIDRHLRRDSDYDIYDSDRPSSRDEKRRHRQDKQSTPQPPAAPQQSHWITLFSFLNDNPNLPTILSYWLQLVWNLVIFTLATAVVLSFVWSIKNDIDHAADTKRSEILAEIFTCRELYDKNRCGAQDRPPALNDVCTNWERCIDQNPTRVARATVSVQTISAIISGFVDTISIKAFSFFLLTVTTLTFVSNWSFVAFRNQCNRKDEPYPYASSSQPPPPTPAHYQHPPVSYPNGSRDPPLSYPNGNQYPLEYPKTPGRNDSPVRQRSFEVQRDEPLLLEDTPSRMGFVTGRTREREQHLHTPSPSKRDRFW
ncbi:hypothetical protein PISL3812_05659 [Talaromyces islandicus]|uniref:Brl1/Brr6 domain-containing protein n=1 Tax=Talaromyces islandicus TaxID=28573 RepID=A0A0U1LZ74_TALIS|nr:hypothetical protein PISL3812_05659 [Talaromyces islandicus]